MRNTDGSNRKRTRPISELKAKARSAPLPIDDAPLFAGLSSAADDARDARELAHRSPFEPGRWSHLARAVGLSPDAPVIVALSGGADSVYLLHLVASARPRPRLEAVHVEHGLRGDAGLEDARFCERLCAELEVPCTVRSVRIDADAPSLEARAREARYQVLCEEAARLSIGTVLTGHHADDALETLLQRWLRGTDLDGLAGLRARLVLPPDSAPRGDPSALRDTRDAQRPSALRTTHGARRRDARGERLNPTARTIEIVRPLIAMRREEVRQSLRERGLEWREDASNASPRFTRNRVRNLFLPELERACGPSAIENLRAFGRAVETLEERCAELTAAIAWDPPAFAAACRGSGETELGGALARERVMELSPALRRRALRRLLAEGTGRPPSASHLDALLADLALGRCRRHGLPGGWTLQLRSSVLHLEPPPSRLKSARGAAASISSASATRAPQLDLPFAAHDTSERASETEEREHVWRLDVPGIVTLDDGRCIGAELVELPPSSAYPRSPTCVELDAGDLEGPLRVRWPRAGDRFRALGAPGAKSLARFLADAGLPRRDRDRVPLVLDAREIVWVAGMRPCESRRVGHTTRRRLRLTLHPAPDSVPRAASTARAGLDAGATRREPAG